MTESRETSVTTTQLRRYELVPGVYPEFVAWWQASIIPVREAAGFRIDWACASADESEFLWTVSMDGTVEDFLALEKTYMASDARAQAFEGQPKRVERAHLSFVTSVGVGPQSSS